MVTQLRKLRPSTNEKRRFRAREELRDFVSTRTERRLPLMWVFIWLYNAHPALLNNSRAQDGVADFASK
jgi:hypothetical protein